MFIQPSNIKLNRILKNRTITFETVKPTHGNMIFIPTYFTDDIIDVVNSKLFRPNQLMAVFTPRIIRLLGRGPVKIDQKDYYVNMRTKTDGRLRYGKITTNTYGGRNLIYDTTAEINRVNDILKTIKSGRGLQSAIYKNFENSIAEKTNDPDYTDNFIVFPMNTYIDNFRNAITTKIDVYNIMILFLRAIREQNIDLEKFNNIKRVIFYNKNADAIFVIDLKDPELFENIDEIIMKLIRINNFNNHTDMLDDPEFTDDSDISEEDAFENKKEEIKTAVLHRISKGLKIKNLTDFEAANKEEKDLILVIDKHVDNFISNPENMTKSFDDLVKSIESNDEIKREAIRYVETKNIGLQKSMKIAKNLEKEISVLSDISEIEAEDAINEPDTFQVDIEDFDERVKESHLSSMDEQYNKKQFKKDIVNIVSGFSTSDFVPLVVDSFSMEDTSDEFNKKETLKVRYRTPDGKSLSFAIDIPKFIDKKYLYLSGNKKTIKKQILRLPVVKTKPNRVEITTNYNKMTIERTSGKLSRKNLYILKLLDNFKANPDVKIVYGDNSVLNFGKEQDFEWEELSGSLAKLIRAPYKMLFNIDEIQETINTLDIDESKVKEMYPIGFICDPVDMDDEKKIVYIKDGIIKEYDITTKEVKDTGADMLKYYIGTVLDAPNMLEKLPPISKSYLYTNVTFLAETYPVFTLIASSNGLTDILKRYHVKYYTSKTPKKNPDYVEVKFKDEFLYFEDIPKNTILLNAIFILHPENYERLEFDLAKPYTDYFISRFGKAIGQYSKNRIKINMDAMIDPITRDVLKDLHLPTDIVDVLLYANTLLVGNTYRPLYDLRQYRIRGNECVAARLYKVIAEAYIKYQEHKLNGNPINLEVSKNSLISKLQQDPNVNDHSLLNPLRELEDAASASAKGFIGVNINRAYTLEMRLYNDTMQGVLSGNASPYSGQMGITRSISANPKLNSVRGYVPDIDQESLSAVNILSPIELMNPFTATSADPPRAAMAVAQTKHAMPVAKSHKQLICTGVNKTVAYMISDDFCFKAKKSGIVEKIDDAVKLAILSYDDGTKDAIDLKEVLVKNSNSGFYIRQQFVMKYGVGERFNKGDVIAYNPSYFAGRGKNVDYLAGALAKVAIAPFDLAFEDANIITESLSKKCASAICMMKEVILGPNSIVTSIIEQGANVKTGDDLITFTSSFDDPDIEKFLSRLSITDATDISGEKVSSKYTGQVTDIKIYYNVPLENMSESLQAVIKKYKNAVQKRRSVLGGIDAESVHIPEVQQMTSNRVGSTEFEGVLIQFYITYDDELGMGDKIAFTTALKGITSKVISEDEAPVPEYRPEDRIEAIMTPTGIISRMTADIYKILYSNKVLVELGKQIRDILEGP